MQGRPFLRQLLAQRLNRGGQAPAEGNAAPQASEADATRTFLRDRIKELQARLDELDKAGGAEDATILEETAGPKATPRRDNA